MKYGALFFLAASALWLGGCSQMPSQAVGPQGGGAPLPLNDEEQSPRAVLPQRPMRRQRRNAALGRSVSPAENAACGGCGGASGCCDYPVWLPVAQRQEGSMIGCAAAPPGGQAQLFSRFNAGAGAAQNALAAGRALNSQNTGAAAGGAPIAAARRPCRSGVFADWCLTRALNPKTGNAYGSLVKGVAVGENWLHYGVKSAPCFGALMIAAQNGQNGAGGGYAVAFCVGALSASQTGAENGARPETVYLGLGVKDEAGAAGGLIGLVAFAAADIAAFRLPQHYHPCKEHFKLDSTLWAEQFREKLRRRRQQSGQDAADNAAAAASPAVPPQGLGGRAEGQAAAGSGYFAGQQIHAAALSAPPVWTGFPARRSAAEQNRRGSADWG